MSDLDNLIADLEAATEGSRELDGRIAVQEGISLSDLNLGRSPHYTTSLDDALPGEHIYMVRKRHDGKWVAGDERERKGSFVAIGATEALARRIAALRARKAEAQHE